MHKDKEWIKQINLDTVDVYPIQFANCDRLRNNDAVYIFDEVGSGKTISSGLMALDYLYNNRDKKVLVITTNALAKKATSSNSEDGQFLKDWMDKLPFDKFRNSVDVVNNYYSNLVLKEKYGVVIVDEAQLFLNEESRRYENLCNIKSDKIVFLTATPIKSSKDDLYVYVKIAKKVTQKEIPCSWIEEISTVGKKPKDIICSKFDVNYPVTRYFKDTIMSLNVEGYQKRQAKRLNPQLWEYDSKEKKDEVLLRRIIEKCGEGNNRFVIFTRFVDNEARAIGELLKKNGFKEFSKDSFTNTEKTYKVVTGENGGELMDFGRTNNLPTVLILTYQIAEQGVNLPGYNHVINYHISAFPSALEQRFGRIDRMGKNGSIYPEINMCFLISRENWDTNTWNFYCAINTYLHNLISYLPSRNTILSTDIIQKFSEAREYVEIYKGRIEKLLEQPEQIEQIIHYFEMLSDDNAYNKSSVECLCDAELFQFIDENGIEIDVTYDRELAVKEFKREVKNVLAEFLNNLGGENYPNEKYIALINSVSDKIFYSDDKQYVNIRTVDAIGECGEDYIEKSENFIAYSQKFREDVKFPLLTVNYLKKINNFFEDKFFANDFNHLFPYEGYAKILEEFFDGEEYDEEAKKLILVNYRIVIPILPIFKLFNLYGDILKNQVYTQRGEIMVRFDFNQFTTAFYLTKRKVLQDIRHLGLSKKFVKMYFEDEELKIYDFTYNNYSGVIQATNWYKLAYHYTRKEEACFINRSTLCLDRDNNFYKIIDELISYLASDYALYDSEQKCWREEDGKHQCAERQLLKYIKCRDEQRGKHQSLFNYFIFTESGNYRTHSMKKCHYKQRKTLCSDWWTQGILSEVYGDTWLEVMLGKITTLPNQFSKIRFH